MGRLQYTVANLKYTARKLCSPRKEFKPSYRLENLKHDLLNPWSRVLLEKLTGFAANQEFPRI
jgi:hypothetical protein